MIFDRLAPLQGPRGGDPKIVPLHVPLMLVTHTPNLVEFRNFFFLLTTQPPMVPPSPTPGA